MRAKLVEYRAARPAWLGFFNLWPRWLANAFMLGFGFFGRTRSGRIEGGKRLSELVAKKKEGP